MADLRKIDSTDGLSEDQFNAQPGRHKGIVVVATGTNNSGQTGGFADIGRFVISRKGDPLINRGAKKFADINDIREGKALLDSTDGGVFEAVFEIPFFEKGHPNALNITDERELNIRFIPGDDGTVFDSLEVEVQSLLASIEERYQYRINGEDVTESSQTSGKPARLNTPNVSSLYIEDVDDIINDLQFESNDRVVVSNNSILALQGYTVLNNRIEDATFDVVEIENHTPGVPGSTLNGNNIIRYSTSGAGDFDVTVCAMDWNNN